MASDEAGMGAVVRVNAQADALRRWQRRPPRGSGSRESRGIRLPETTDVKPEISTGHPFSTEPRHSPGLFRFGFIPRISASTRTPVHGYSGRPAGGGE